jgi:hypothetical protein
MTYTVFYENETYELPNSMREFDGMSLSHLKLVNVLVQDNEIYTGYQIFIGVLISDDEDVVNIIYGTYFNDYPRNDFNCISVDKLEMIDVDNILDIGLNSCAVLLKKEIIIIRTDPEFSSHYERFGEAFDYDGEYLFIKRFTFDSEMINFLWGLDVHVDITVRKNDISCMIFLSFTYRSYSSRIEISISNEEIRLRYEITRTNKYKEVHCGHNDSPSYRNVEEITDEQNFEEIYSMEKEPDESEEPEEE